MFDRAHVHRVDGRFAVWVLLRMRQSLLCLLTMLFTAASLAQETRVNGYRNPPKSGGKDGLRFLVWRALLRGAEMELLNRHADVRGKKD